MKTIKITKEQIDNIFETAIKGSSDYVIDLYKIAFPDWNKIQKIEGYPTISKNTANYIMDKAIKFENNSPFTVWFNVGFSTLEAENLQVKDWEINLSTAHVKYI